jgi:hypothetical protein
MGTYLNLHNSSGVYLVSEHSVNGMIILNPEFFLKQEESLSFTAVPDFTEKWLQN